MKNTSAELALQALIVSTIFVLMDFFFEGRSGLNLGDEGFLWYGAQRVMHGAVPIRDFMAYDPGRYYWSAAFMDIWGNDGIIALRVAVATFQAIGLFFGLFLLGRVGRGGNFLFLVVIAITMMMWMYPRHKLFDISISIILISALAFLVEKQIWERYFFAGLCVGVVATFGRNHGVYGIFGSLGVMVWLSIGKRREFGFGKGVVFWSIGVILGFSPIILMALLLPGFAISFIESIRFLFEIKSTNLPLPIPWPWQVKFSSIPLEDTLREMLIGIFFIGIVAFGVLSVSWVFQKRLQGRATPSTLVAASFFAFPYAHYAYSRADVNHLAQGIFPFLIGSFALLATQSFKVKWSLSLILCGTSVWVMCVIHPGWQCQINRQCVNVEISGSNLLMDAGTASDVTVLRNLAGSYAPAGRSFVAAPFWPGAYALLGRQSPMWEIYALFPRSLIFQRVEIERIKKAGPGFVIVNDAGLDGRDDLRFSNTHALVYKYILDNFDRLPEDPSSDNQIYKAKGLQ